MSEEVVERMQSELVHDWDKIVAPFSMGTEIIGSIKELYRSFVWVEEAWGRGKEIQSKVEISLGKVEEWGSKLAILGNVAHKNLLPKLPLLELDEVLSCDNILATSKQALDDGGTPLIASNKQLESVAHDINTLLDSIGLLPVMKPDNSLPTEVELDVSLGEFANQFVGQLASVEE